MKRNFDMNMEQDDPSDIRKIFLVVRPGLGAFYNYVGSTMNLRKRRNAASSEVEQVTQLKVKARKFTAEEKKARKEKLATVAPYEELEDESDEEEEEVQQNGEEEVVV